MKNWKNTYPLDVISGETKKELVCLIESLLEEQKKETEADIKTVLNLLDVKIERKKIANFIKEYLIK